MSASGFARDASHSVFEALRPATGQTLDRAAFATYSLDLVTIAALILSLGRACEQELEAGPLGLVDAMANIAPRIDIVHQKDRLKPPARHFGVLQMLDRRIHAVQPPRGASYHPKLALARYWGPGGVVSWKLWLGSRNLTGGQDREAGMLLVGRVGGARGSRIPQVADMALELLEPVIWIAELASELRGVRWRAPDDVKVMGFQWRKAGERKAFTFRLRGATRTIAVSPFVDDGGCASLGECANSLLLTTREAALGLQPRPGRAIVVARPPTYGLDMPAEPPAAAPALDDASVPEPAGLHAKLILRQSGAASRLWIGSANLTRRGLAGPNAEVMAELDIPVVVADALVEYVEDCEPFDGVEAGTDTDAIDRRAAERALDDALVTIVGADLELRREADGLTLFSATSFDAFLAGHSLEAWLLTRPSAVVAWKMGAHSALLVPGGVPLKLETVLMCFRAERSSGDCPARTWAQVVRFAQHDADARDRAATAAYIGLAGASAWVRSQLEGILPTEPTTWTGAARWKGSENAGGTDLLPLALEEVLAAWARNPDEFERRAGRLEGTLAALGEELAQTPEGERDAAALASWSDIEGFWSAIRQAIGIADDA